jgi:prepilin-type processing-associated H-X9-DG protein
MGLAMANYESTYNRFPLPTLGTAAANPTTAGGLGTGNVWSIAVLPFMDQGNVYNQYNMNTSAYDTSNANVVKTVLTAYLCPSSARAGNTITYTIPAAVAAALTGPSSAANLTLTGAGACDYIVTTRIRSEFLDAAQGVAKGTNPQNDATMSGFAVGGNVVMNGVTGVTQNFPNGGRISDITDGTSNTTMIVELANRNILLENGKTIAVGGPTPDDGGAAFYQSLIGGGAWADGFNGNWEISGRQPSGSVAGGLYYGPCAINCSNARQAMPGTAVLQNAAGLYSYHAGGAQALLCDGSVRFLNANMSSITMAALVTRAGGEPVGDF